MNCFRDSACGIYSAGHDDGTCVKKGKRSYSDVMAT